MQSFVARIWRSCHRPQPPWLTELGTCVRTNAAALPKLAESRFCCTACARSVTCFCGVASFPVLSMLMQFDAVEHGPALATFVSSSRSRVICMQVCLSVPLVWAWLQGNSRARRPYSAVPARAGFGFPRTLPASPFQEHKQCAPDPPKNCFAWLESGPLRSGSPQPIGAGKED
jgi:hypothetical protein